LEQFVHKIEAFDREVTFESLKEFILSFDFDSLDYQSQIIEPEVVGDYGRNILTLHPFECVLIKWPPGVESAVHHHKGLFGYVLVLEGELDNVNYRRTDETVEEYLIDKYVEGGLMPEPDGVIHKLRNNSETEGAVTLHFYYPAIHSFKGMRLYNMDTGDIGVLDDSAISAHWIEREGQFLEIERSAFRPVTFAELNEGKSHFICNVFPKPTTDTINRMNGDYFSEQAAQYDFSDFNQPNRNEYINAIDRLIGEDLKESGNTKKHLDVAIGTARRALNVREISGLDYEIVGADISEEMSRIANSRGIRTYHQDWANDDAHIGEYFDSATFLYAFGHIATIGARVKTLEKINSYLNSGGTFYFDLFSITNKNEWGVLANTAFDENNLSQFGYDRGDVFYRKKNCRELSFLHYFGKDEIIQLLDQCGFDLVYIKHVGYAKNAGQIVSNEDEGNLFVKAIKR
jgi:ubiquinone/menaquinone biosynthesis C-methylase UbiE